VAQINLLKQNSSNTSLDIGKNVPKILVRAALVILVALAGYYGWLYFKSKSIEGQTSALKIKMDNEVRTGLGQADRNEVLTRQLQIKTLSGLIPAHLYWSQLFQPLADATLKNASYTNFETNANGTISLDVSVPSLEDLDKFLQVFNLADYNKNFSDVMLGGYTKADGKNGSKSYNFQVKLKFNPQLIQYKNTNSNAG